jgi:hypothetical protein
MSALLNEVLTPAGEFDLSVKADECCPECDRPLLAGGEDLAGLVGDDEDGLPGFALFHDGCLSNRLLRLL